MAILLYAMTLCAITLYANIIIWHDIICHDIICQYYYMPWLNILLYAMTSYYYMPWLYVPWHYMRILLYAMSLYANIIMLHDMAYYYRVSCSMLNPVPKPVHFMDYLNFGGLFDFFLWSICWNLCNLALVIWLLI